MYLNTPFWNVQRFEDQERCWHGHVFSEGVSGSHPPHKRASLGTPAAGRPLCSHLTPPTPLCTQGAWPEPRVRRPPPHTCHTPHGTGVATDSGDAGAGLRQRRSSGPPHPDWSWGPAADAQPSELQGTPDHAQRLDASPTALCVRGTTLRDTGVSIMCGGSFSIVRVRELEAWPRAALI